MTNIAVVGNCYDRSGNRIDINYKVEYPKNEQDTPVLSTSNKQLIFNTNDKDHLGYNGGVRIGETVYITGWETAVDSFNTIRKCRKRLVYDGNAVMEQNIILYEDLILSTDISYINNEDTYIFKPNVRAVDPIVEVIYNIYYNANQVSIGNASDDYKLIKTISENDDRDVVINFSKSGMFKITCEAVIVNNEVSEISEVFLDIDATITVDPTIPTEEYLQKYYIEWE